MENSGVPIHWYIAVGSASRSNFERALTTGIWGAKDPKKFRDVDARTIGVGDTVHFFLSPRWEGDGPSPSGFPRISLDQYRVRADETIVKVTSPVYEDENPIWDDDVYPSRFRFSIESRNVGVRLAPGAVSDPIRDAARRSLIEQGKAIPVSGQRFSLNQALHKVLELFPEARRQRFPDHPVADVIKRDIPIGLRELLDLPHDRYLVLSSVGQGNWATVPWVAILDSTRGGSIQDGLYVAILFSAEMDRVILSLMYGVTGPADAAVKANGSGLGKRIQNLRRRLHLGGTTWKLDNDIKLAERGVGSHYGQGIVLYRAYAADALPSDPEWAQDIQEILDLYQESFKHQDSDEGTDRLRPKDGETSAKESTAPYKMAFDLVKAHARVTSLGYQVSREDLLNVLLCIAVRPFVIFSGRSGTGKTTLARIVATLFDWHYESVAVSPAWADPADLLGFISPVNQQRVDGALMTLLNGRHDHALLCLDEFNVAKVEHYFSDFISAMDGDPADGFWGELASLQRLAQKGETGWTLPDHLNVVATMNFDDSVQSITPRVLDRANVVDFDITRSTDLVVGRSLDWPRFLVGVPFQWPWTWSGTLGDEPSEDIIRKLWQSLRGSRGQFGHRVAQEIHRYIGTGLPFDKVLGRTEGQHRQGLLDRQVVQRLLPKFHGSASSRDMDALMKLVSVLMDRDPSDGVVSDRQAIIDEALNDGRFPRVAAKIQQLVQSYTEDGYASFW